MKALLFILISLSCLFQSCKELYSKEPINDGVYILADISDSFPEVSKFSVEQIKPLLTLNMNSMCGATVWVASVSDLRYTASHRISLENTNQLSENEFDRKTSIDSFYARINNRIKEIQGLKADGTNGTHLFFSLSNSLQNLASCTSCTSKTLIVLSDLREYSNLFNTYDSIELNMFQTNPKEMEELIDYHYHIPSLKGINIYLIHEPISKADDDAFHLLSNFLKTFLEKKGAKVTISSHLQSI